MALTYITSATMYKALCDKEFCIVLLAFCTRLLSEEMRDFDRYRSQIHNVVFALVEEVKSAAIVAGRPFRRILLNQVPVPASEKMVTVRNSTSVALWTFHRFKKDRIKGAQSSLRYFRPQVTTAIGASFSQNTLEPTAFAALASLLPFFFLLLGALPSAAPHAFLPRSQPSS